MNPKPRYEPAHPGSGRLLGRVALITGGDSGIGRAVAVLFAWEGANLVITHLKEKRDAEETRRLVEAEGRNCLVLAGDVGNEAVCRTWVKRTMLVRMGRI